MPAIWYANRVDIPRLVALAAQEHALSKWQHIPFDPEAAAMTAAAMIEGHGKTVIMSRGGYLAGMVQPAGFSRRLLALEYAWFATDGQGLALLSRFERWARNMGAAELVVHNYTDDRRLSRALAIRGRFRPMGQAMTKNLEA